MPQFSGSVNRPIKRTRPDRASRIIKRNGWSARKTSGIFFGRDGADFHAGSMTVTDAASVPSFATSTYALYESSRVQARYWMMRPKRPQAAFGHRHQPVSCTPL
jgi:hypothetical protein